jgi:uncharacterized membrane protein (UPF0127 family)
MLCVLLVSLLGVGCSSDDPAPQSAPGPSFDDGRLAFVGPDDDTLATLAIAVADTEAERGRGLMRQRSLGYDRGMLFIFDEPNTTGMWMKNTPLPLDIVFVAPDSQVLNIARRTTPFSEENIAPVAHSKFAVEVRAGFADKFGLRPGTRIRWTQTE